METERAASPDEQGRPHRERRDRQNDQRFRCGLRIVLASDPRESQEGAAAEAKRDAPRHPAGHCHQPVAPDDERSRHGCSSRAGHERHRRADCCQNERQGDRELTRRQREHGGHEREHADHGDIGDRRGRSVRELPVDDVEGALRTRNVGGIERERPPLTGAIDGHQPGRGRSRGVDAQLGQAAVADSVRQVRFAPVEPLGLERDHGRAASECFRCVERRNRAAGRVVDGLDAPRQARMRCVALEAAVPPARKPHHRVQLDQGAHHRIGIAGQLDGACVAFELVLLARTDAQRLEHEDEHHPEDEDVRTRNIGRGHPGQRFDQDGRRDERARAGIQAPKPAAAVMLDVRELVAAHADGLVAIESLDDRAGQHDRGTAH